MAKQDFKFKTTIRVRWMEGDAQGIVFNGSYLGYLEIAQSEYFRNLGFSIYRIAQAGYFDTAVVKTTLEFKAPARVDQMLDLYARAAAIGTTSLTREVEIFPSPRPADWPRPWVIMKFTISGVTFSAAPTRSPSFSRSSLSTTITSLPFAIASTACSMREN